MEDKNKYIEAIRVIMAYKGCTADVAVAVLNHDIHVVGIDSAYKAGWRDGRVNGVSGASTVMKEFLIEAKNFAG